MPHKFTFKFPTWAEVIEKWANLFKVIAVSITALLALMVALDKLFPTQPLAPNIAEDMDTEGTSVVLPSDASVDEEMRRIDAEARQLFQKGNTAYRRFSYTKAISFYQSALDLVDLPLFHRALGNGHLAKSQYPSALHHFNIAQSRYDKTNNRIQKGWVLNGIGVVRQQQGLWMAAQRHHQQALAIGRNAGRKDLIAESRTRLGAVFKQLGQWKVAEDHLKAAHRHFKKMDNRLGRAECLLNLGLIFQQQNQPDKARRYYERALAIEQDRHHPRHKHLRADLLGNQGLVLQLKQDLDEALGCHKNALDIYRELGNAYGQARALGNIALVYRQRSEWDQAIEAARQSLRMYSDLDCKSGIAKAEANLGRIYIRKGNLLKAEEAYRQCLTKAEATGDARLQARSLIMLGIFDLKEERFESALEKYEKALAMNRKSGSQKTLADNLINIGTAHYHMQQPEKALENYGQALDIYRSLELLEGQAHCLFNIGEVMMDDHQFTIAKEMYEQAGVLYRSLGLQLQTDLTKDKLKEVNKRLLSNNTASRHSGPPYYAGKKRHYSTWFFIRHVNPKAEAICTDSNHSI